jgi:hypothetical protein
MISRFLRGLNLADGGGVRAATTLAVLLSGCFYTDAVNLPPVARIDRAAGPYHVGDIVALSATSSTDDQTKALAYSWAAACPGCVAQEGTDGQFNVYIAGHDTLRVTVTVVDEHGASGTASVDLVVTDRAPTLVVQAPPPSALGTYTVGAPIAIATSVGDPDGDTVTLNAVPLAPSASNPDHMTFTRTGAGSWSLVPDVPGHWEVAVTAADGFGQTTTVTQGLEVVADAPPCIAATTPAAPPQARFVLDISDGPRRFAVDSVTDDLDPWPAAGSQLGFRWFIADAEVDGHDLPDLTFDPMFHAPGDVIPLRVEIADRVARTLPCPPDQAECSIAGDGCRQRVTWTVELR